MKSALGVATVSLLILVATRGRALASTRDEPPPRRAETQDRTPREPEREHFRAGVLGSLGFPRPLAIEGLVRIERIVGIGAEYSALPQLSLGSVRTEMWAVAGDVRLFPFGNAFFVGARVGRQHVGASASVVLTNLGTYSESVTIDSWFVNPRIGVLWRSSPGITLGIDAGVQLPFASSESSTLPREGFAIAATAASIPETLGKGVLPTIDLLQVGVLF